MPQPFADALSWVPKSRHLAATLSRAHDFARGLAHQTVTLEHVLLALIEDPDASVVLQACDIDLARLRADADGYLVGQPKGQPAVLEADRDLVRILDYAVAAAQQSRRREVNGAIVLAAIVGEGKSQAATILQGNGLTFAEAIRALQTAGAAPRSGLPAASAAASQTTEQILASTRQRLDASRLGPSGSRPLPAGPTESLPPTMVNGVPSQPASVPARGNRLPPPIPSAQAGPSASSGAPRQARELAGGLVEAIRTAGGAWSQSGAPPASNSHQAAAEAGYETNVAGPPFPDPDTLTPATAEQAAAGRKAATAPPLQPSALDPTKLSQSIPRKMRLGAAAAIEVRIARAEIAALAKGLDGSSAVYQHSIVVTKAMAVRLRAPDGGFYIETASPETQWIESSLGFLNDDYASWRWMVTPRRRGRRRLLLTVSVRTIGSDGATAETALPDQTIEVSVGANRLRGIARWSGWIVAVVVGGLLAKLGEAQWQAGLVALRRLFE
jgi:hypothetical protein